MMLKTYSPQEAGGGILRRPDFDEIEATPAQLDRLQTLFGQRISPDGAVRQILRGVRQGGDKALQEWSERLDGAAVPASGLRDGFRVTPLAVQQAYALVAPELVAALQAAAVRIADFHSRQVIGSWMEPGPDGILGQQVVPIGRVGCYVPGGAAPLASTLLMTALVAKAAGVPEIVVASPAWKNTGVPAPIVLVAADICGINEIYAVGGAQAIGALAYGTESIKRVDKICGPGNTFVVLAKRQVFGTVGIDSLPGQTETAIVADGHADVRLLAADMLAQSEHVGGVAVLFTDNAELIGRLGPELERQTAALPTAAAIRESFALRSGAVLCRDIAQAVALADTWAPEHFCLSVAEPWQWVGQIRRAGGIFVGENSYEVLGDYVAGPSHVMPTGGTARFTSPCNILDFVRVMNIIALNDSCARRLAPLAVQLAESEGLAAHANSARVRL